MGVTSSTGKKGFNSTGEGIPTTLEGAVGGFGITGSNSRKGQTETEPPWVKAVQVPPEFAQDQMGSLSDGFTATGPYSVVRSRTGHFDSDAVRWGRGFTSGKHAFEIHYPVAQRGAEATVGVGTSEADLYAKGKVPLVGHNRTSWGISLRTKRAFHRNAMVKKYPVTQVQLPDKFYMYVDADAGLIQFGTDVEYYGTACSNIPRDQPIYPMASSTAHGANIAFVYRGQGSNVPPPPVAVVVVQNHPPPPPYDAGGQAAPPPPSAEVSGDQEKAPEPASAPPAEEKAQE